MAYVIRSGDGFLFNPETFSVIRHRRNAKLAARAAARYASREDAVEDIERMKKQGFVVELVDLRKVA